MSLATQYSHDVPDDRSGQVSQTRRVISASVVAELIDLSLVVVIETTSRVQRPSSAGTVAHQRRIVIELTEGLG